MTRWFVVSMLLCASALNAGETVYYVPIAFAYIGDSVAGPRNAHFYTYWATMLHAFNSTSEVQTITYRAVYGGAGAELQTWQPGCSTTYPYALQPHGAADLERAGLLGCVAYQKGAPGFIELTATDGITLSAEVERVSFTADCGASEGNVVSQGHALCPIYRGTFPAGALATCGAIDLGSQGLEIPCVSENQKYLRRVNLTLFNAGAEPAAFTVTLYDLTNLNPKPVEQLEYTLDAKEVRQVNRIPLPPLSSLENDAYSIRVWCTITATQPFLGYISTIFENGEPGSMPFEVYPAHLGGN